MTNRSDYSHWNEEADQVWWAENKYEDQRDYADYYDDRDYDIYEYADRPDSQKDESDYYDEDEGPGPDDYDWDR